MKIDLQKARKLEENRRLTENKWKILKDKRRELATGVMERH